MRESRHKPIDSDFGSPKYSDGINGNQPSPKNIQQKNNNIIYYQPTEIYYNQPLWKPPWRGKKRQKQSNKPVKDLFKLSEGAVVRIQRLGDRKLPCKEGTVRRKIDEWS